MNQQQQPQQITDEQRILIETVQLRIATQRYKLQQQQRDRKAEGQ
jgi:hypothetical protein